LTKTTVLYDFGLIYILSPVLLLLFGRTGGENEEDVSNSVYYLNHAESHWDLKSEEMVSGVTETTIYSSYSVMNLSMDLD